MAADVNALFKGLFSRLMTPCAISDLQFLISFKRSDVLTLVLTAALLREVPSSSISLP